MITPGPDSLYFTELQFSNLKASIDSLMAEAQVSADDYSSTLTIATGEKAQLADTVMPIWTITMRDSEGEPTFVFAIFADLNWSDLSRKSQVVSLYGYTKKWYRSISTRKEVTNYLADVTAFNDVYHRIYKWLYDMAGGD